MIYQYTPHGVCSTNMIFDIEEDIIRDLKIEKGCAGNTLGIIALIQNKKIDDVIAKLENIPCGNKKTSCPDQIAKALKIYKQKRNI